MNLDTTRQSLSVTLVSFIVLFVLFVGHSLLSPYPITGISGSHMPLGALIDRVTHPWPSMVRIGLLFCIIFLNAFTLTRIVTRNMILGQRTYLPALIYLIVACGLYLALDHLSIGVASYLLIRGCESLIASFKRQESCGKLFSGAFMIGLTPLLYAPAVVYALLVPIATRIFRRNGRETIAALAGLLLPFLLCSYIVWAIGDPIHAVAHQLYDDLILSQNYPSFNTQTDIPRLIFLAIIILTTSLSLGNFCITRSSMRTRPQRAYQLFIWMLLCALGSIFIPGQSVLMLNLLAIPLGVIMPTFLVQRNGLSPELLFIALTLSTLIINLDFIWL